MKSINPSTVIQKYIFKEGFLHERKNKNREVVKYILENYDIQNANDITKVSKDVFKDTIQTMMNAEF